MHKKHTVRLLITLGIILVAIVLFHVIGGNFIDMAKAHMGM